MTTPATYALCTCTRCGETVPRRRMATKSTTTGKPRGECRVCHAADTREYVRLRAAGVPPQKREAAPVTLVACACGCGALIPERDSHYRRPRFARGHNMRVAGLGARL